MDYRDPNDDNQNAKQRILNAAEEVFAEKGFDGARVDDISNRAGVNKALLYYYFSGKQDLFEELVKGHIEDIIKSRYGMLLEKPQLKEKAMSISSTFDMFKDKKEVLRMTLMEMMKSKSNDHFLFKLFDYMFNDIK
ncbi:MAG TPA: TetR/AcrR family transcriptional regulator, partial [Firmicutes bacterium]|nr:TetR/AcrR family transcriptional regulator [Bacillota bacterium]